MFYIPKGNQKVMTCAREKKRILFYYYFYIVNQINYSITHDGIEDNLTD